MFACKGIKAVYSGKISRLCTSGLFRRNLSAAKIAFLAVCCTCRTRFVSGHGLLSLRLRPGGCRAQMRRAEIVHRILICSCRAAKRHAGASSRDQTGCRGFAVYRCAAPLWADTAHWRTTRIRRACAPGRSTGAAVRATPRPPLRSPIPYNPAIPYQSHMTK